LGKACCVSLVEALRSDYMGGAYYFCSFGCLEAFTSHPDDYLAKHAPAQ
jgi:YHS domain-containing protein